MLSNYLKLAFRHFFKNKVYTLITLSGLALSSALFYFMVVYVSFQLSYDNFYPDKDRIFRVTHQQFENGTLKNNSAGTFFGMASYLSENYPEVDKTVHFYKWPANTGVVLLADHKVFNERNYLIAENSFFQVFGSLLIEGDASTCLGNPNSIVISKRMAVKMFGTANAMGKVIADLSKKDFPLTVTGIMRDLPENSHLDADVVLPFDAEWIPKKEDYWSYPNNWTYVLLRKEADPKALESKVNAALGKASVIPVKFNGSRAAFQKITDIYLTSDLKDEIKANGNIKVVYGVAAAAFVILLLAWINYINLETGQLLSRAGETAVRRVIGSTKTQIFIQFVTEYICLTFLSIVVAIGVVILSSPYFSLITGFSIPALTNITIWPLVAGVTFFTVGVIVAGIYPALFMIKFNPVLALKGKSPTNSSSLLKKSLLTFQFVASIVLLALLIVVFQQLSFMRSTGKNLDVERVLTIYNPTSYSIFDDTLKKERSLDFRNKILQGHQFENVSASSAVPGEPVGFSYENLTKRSMSDPDDGLSYKVLFVDYYYLPVYGLKLKAGRNYSVDSGEDNNLNSLVLNESAIHALGFKSAEEALNQEIYFEVTFDWKKYRIIGIVEDFRHESVKAPVYPTIFFLHRYVGQMTYYSIHLDKNTSSKDAVARAEEAWKQVWPEKPFNYYFMDQHYDQQYKSEITFQRISGIFAAVAIFLACLGVLGITIFDTRSRLREISIRKILGATVAGLVTLLFRTNVILVLVSAIIAFPIIYFLSNEWLSDYPVRISFSLWYLAAPLFATLLLVLITSGVQTIRSASTNPVDHLRNNS